MATGRVTIRGSNYSISGGMATVNATGYALSHGKTTIGGTSYTINLRIQDVTHLLRTMTIVKSAGINASTANTVSVSLTTAGTFYALVFYNGYIGIHKLVCTGSAITKTALKQVSTSQAGIYISGTTAYVSTSGSSYVRAYGASLFIVKFPGYTVTEADAIIQALSFSRLATRNSSAAKQLSYDGNSLVGKIAVVAVNTNVAFTKVSTFSNSSWSYSNLFSNYSTNSTLLTAVDGYLVYSNVASGTATNVYGGSFLSLNL